MMRDTAPCCGGGAALQAADDRACGGVLSAIATVLLVPPVNLAWIATAGLLLSWRRCRAGRWVALAALGGLLVLSVPLVPTLLLAGLEHDIRPASGKAQAIVILGGDDAPAGPSETETEVGPLTLERLRAGANLARATGLPVLVTGDVVSAAGPPVAVLMQHSLAADFGIAVRWVEPDAANTWENAALSTAMLRRAGIGTALVVTHAWHMRRALIAFRAAGLTALPVPVLPEHAPQLFWGALVPRASAWQRSYFALHEWIGCAWYALKAR
jgi:uncharacterized SAM-binding protein YcdF (DUF218 family)